RGETPALPASFVEAFAATLEDQRLDPAFRAEALTLPTEAFLFEQMETADPEAVYEARELAPAPIRTALPDALVKAYERDRASGPCRIDAEAMGRRALKNLALSYIAAPRCGQAGLALALEQFAGAANMTDLLAALSLIGDVAGADRERAFTSFYQRWQEDALVVDKWFALQAMARLPDAVDRVRALLEHPAFSYAKPNRVFALILNFIVNNPVRFHGADGSGYRFLADQVLAIDPLNPQVASRLMGPLTRWRRQDHRRQDQMRGELSRILNSHDLSKQVYEIVSKGLA